MKKYKKIVFKFISIIFLIIILSIGLQYNIKAIEHKDNNKTTETNTSKNIKNKEISPNKITKSNIQDQTQYKFYFEVPEVYNFKHSNNVNWGLEWLKLIPNIISSLGGCITAFGAIITAIATLIAAFYAAKKYLNDREQAEKDRLDRQFISLSDRASSPKELIRANAISSLTLFSQKTKDKISFDGKNYYELSDYIKEYNKHYYYVSQCIIIIINSLVNRGLSRFRNIKKSNIYTISEIEIACSYALSIINDQSKHMIHINKSKVPELHSIVCLEYLILTHLIINRLNIKGACFIENIIKHTSLEDAFFNNVSFEENFFYKTNLTQSKFNESTMKNMVFFYSNLSNTDFKDVKYIENKSKNAQQKGNNDIGLVFIGCNLVNIINFSLDIEKINFQDCIIDKNNYEKLKLNNKYRFQPIDLQSPSSLKIRERYPNIATNQDIGILLSPKGEDQRFNLGTSIKWDKLITILKEDSTMSKDAYYSLGVVYDELDIVNEAKDNYLKAIENDPDCADAYYSLATLYEHLNEVDEAINKYQEAISKDETLIYACFNLANIYRQKKKNELTKAIEYYEKAISKKQDEESFYYGLALCYFELKEFDKAIPNYQEVIKLNPNKDRAYNDLGTCYYETDDFAKAIDSLQKSKDLNSSNFDDYYKLGKSQLEIGHYEDSIVNLKEEIKKNPTNNNAFISLARSLDGAKDYQNAIENYIKVLDNKPEASIYSDLASCYLKDNDEENAIINYKKAIELEPENYFFYYNLGELYYNLDRNIEANEIIKKAIELKPDDQEAIDLLGKINLKLNS